MKLLRGDEVIVLTGRDRGQKGAIIKVLPQLNQVVVDGINMVKRAYKPTQSNPKGGIKTEPRPMPVSKVAIVHPSAAKRGSRIGYLLKNGQKQRVYRQAKNQVISQSKPKVKEAK